MPQTNTTHQHTIHPPRFGASANPFTVGRASSPPSLKHGSRAQTNISRLLAPAVIILLTLALISAPSRAEVRNLTEENRKDLAAKVLDLRHTELMKISRGRLKANPVILPMFDAYQILTQDQDMLLNAQLQDYRSALTEIGNARRDFTIFNSTPLGREVTAIFYQRLTAAYHLKPRIEKLNTLWLVWRELSISRARLQTLPVEYRLALNAGKWLNRMPGSGATITATSNPASAASEFTTRYLAICREEPSPSNVFEADRSVSEISEKYSRLFSDIAAAEKKQP